MVGIFCTVHSLLDAHATLEHMETVEVIDYSELVVFDAFNGSYLSSQDYRGLLSPGDQEPGIIV
jgi:hypothetical protein